MSEQVTQRDREAAYMVLGTFVQSDAYRDQIKGGMADHDPIVRAFARHRRETREEAALVAERRPTGPSAAQAIRNLK